MKASDRLKNSATTCSSLVSCPSFVILAAILAGCMADYTTQFSTAVNAGDFVSAKLQTQQEIRDYTKRDLNPTLPMRLSQAYYRLAYAHGRLAEYDSMRSALSSCVSYDASHADERQEMLDYFATVEYNNGVASFTTGDKATAYDRMKKAATICQMGEEMSPRVQAYLRGVTMTALSVGKNEEAKVWCRQWAVTKEDEAIQAKAAFDRGDAPVIPSAFSPLPVAQLEFR